jgi:hypothetical protein
MFAKGRELYGNGDNSGALSLFEAAYKCQPNGNTLKLMFAAACRAGAVGKAKLIWKKLSSATKDATLSICVGAGITLDVLTAP